MIADEQVLVCPQCQAAHDWRADLDRCGSCGSTMLVRALGETRCRECAWAKSAAPRRKDTDSTLADDVAAALQRRFGR